MCHCLPLPSDVKGEVTEMATYPNDVASENSGTAMRMTQFDVAYYHHESLLLRANQINDSETPLHTISDGHVISLAQSSCLYGFDHAKGTLTVTTTATETG